MEQNAPVPEIKVPLNTEMATEPATTIGELFGSKHMIKTYLMALAGVVAFVFKLSVDEGFIDQLATLILYSMPIVLTLMAKFEQWQLARQQGRETREAVVSPETAAKLAEQAASAGTVRVEVEPDRNKPVVTKIV